MSTHIQFGGPPVPQPPRVRVESMGLGLYRGEIDVKLTSSGITGKSNPYRSAFLSNIKIVHAWAFSRESAARRAAVKARKVQDADAKWAADVKRRTTYEEVR